MPATSQAGGDDGEYRTSKDRQIATWSDDLALSVVPMTRESAVGYWNAVNRQDASDRVRDHFRECLGRFRE